YYRMQLTSIYEYLGERFGVSAYKTGAVCFLLSRIVGASFRLYLVAMVFQLAVFEPLDVQVPFAVTVFITIALIWVYTAKGGIKTIIWTDTLQTAFMLLAVIVGVWAIAGELGLSITGMAQTIAQSDFSRIFFFDDVNDSRYFWKQFLAGASITIAMTGLDQDMMQKNLSCRNIGDAQKNMVWFSLSLAVVNLLFLSLGALLYTYAIQTGFPIPEKPDELFPRLALSGVLGSGMAILFILGLIAAAYSSADSALTALTTSFCVDMLGVQHMDNQRAERLRRRVHMGMSVVLLIVILAFSAFSNDSVIKELFTVAGFTYGPLLGLFFFGLLTKISLRDRWVPVVAIAAPLLTWMLYHNSAEWMGGYKMSFELLLINGLLTAVGLFVISIPKGRKS
ncbi:MAG: sodium:solute symporter, partial [Flavobacteriales bacterium]|nr:sodium:solute symporter [Flavobacteriales bacterium]